MRSRADSRHGQGNEDGTSERVWGVAETAVITGEGDVRKLTVAETDRARRSEAKGRIRLTRGARGGCLKPRPWVAPGASTVAAERRTAIQAGGIPRSYVSSDPDQTLRFFAGIWVAFLRLVAGFRRPRKLPFYLQIGSHLNIQSDKLTKPGPWGELNPVIRRVHKLIVDLIFWLKCISWGALIILALWLCLRRFRRVYRTHWYDLSREGPLEEMKWQQIREATEKDPLDHQRCCRWSKEWLTIDCTVLVILLLFVGYIFVLNIHPDWLGADGKNIQELFQEFVLPASALALVGTIVTVFYKVRLTARAKNRQQWINSVRKHIHTLIANCPSRTIPK